MIGYNWKCLHFLLFFIGSCLYLPFQFNVAALKHIIIMTFNITYGKLNSKETLLISLSL